MKFLDRFFNKKLRTCKWCGSEFEDDGQEQSFCSEECDRGHRR